MGTRKRKHKHPGLYFKGPYWWLRHDPVTGRAESTRCTDLEAARAYQAQRERQALDPSHAAPRLGEQCARFVELKAPRVAPATVGFFREKLGHWVRVFGQNAALGEVGSPAAGDRYVAQRRSEGASDHTISKEVRVFRQVLHIAKRAGHYTGDLAALKPHDLTTSYVPRKRALTLEDVERVHPELGARTGALLDLAVGLGLRLSEAEGLRPEDVDLIAGQVRVRGTKTAGSDRTVPVLSPYRHLVERALPHLPVGKVNNMRRNAIVAFRRAGVEYASPNDWRRSHATILAELGVDRDVTRRFLGHTSTQMVDRVYSQPRVDALAALAEHAIAQRSNGVAEHVQDGASCRGFAAAKCAESLPRPLDTAAYSGFLSRRSHVRIVPGALKTCGFPCSAPEVVAERSNGVANDVLDRAWGLQVVGVWS